jgi:hypothetical protein
MTGNEGSTTKRQRPAGHNATNLYEPLRQFNEHCFAALAALKACTRVMKKPNEEYCRLLIEEARALASQTIVERLSDSELAVATSTSRRRTALERRMSK